MTFDTAQILAQTKLFPGLDADQLAAVASKTTFVKLAAGEKFCEEGDNNAKNMFIILTGAADVFKAGAGGDSVKLISLHAREYIGESLLEGLPINATVVASQETTALKLNSEEFKSIITQHPAIAESLLKGLAKELRSFRTVLARAVSLSTSSNTPTPTSTERVVRLAVFDFMKHERVSFERAVADFRASLAHTDTDLKVSYFEVKLDATTVRLAAGCDAVCIFVNDSANAAVLTLLAQQGVRLVALRCAGFDMIDLKAAAALDLQVARVPAYSPYAVAEFAVTLALGLNRKIVTASGRVKSGNFSLAGLVGFDLHGKTVGVIGTGKIGQCFIKIMQGFGCKILCYDAYPSKDVATWENCTYVTLDELYAQSRVISLHAPLLPETKYMINSKSIAKMVKGVLLINTSRGGLVNTQDLIEGLKSGQVGGAGLDVYENEKALYFEDHSDNVMEDDAYARLTTFPNVLVTGHQAFLTEEALDKIGSVTMDNVRQCLFEGKVGKELTNVVL
ncbi:hypothetical protein HK100_002163 [Physocladia obscura]|uniref:Cyclic nucleotide-binding domain-containing protein n=1 Tax=Physocladia obscura TaxID=109957 RepID=A0AAD5SW69_9FUNG|nr:hypothetical protein HK100_002163 [Physocladia obscura]